MRKKNNDIPINTLGDDSGAGIAIDRMTAKDLRTLTGGSPITMQEANRAHREDRHSFFLLEKGTVKLEIDFKKFTIRSGSVIYLHPDQVHRIISFQNMTVSSWAIDNEKLNPEYLKMLEDLKPAPPIALNRETFSLFAGAVSLFGAFSDRKNDTLYQGLLKDSCNALVALVISQYAKQAKPTGKQARAGTIAKAFRQMLERSYLSMKRPTEYAQRLNVSTPYLNECVREITGYPVSYHIQQRIVLGAKRLLYHSDKSVKEIAAELGYDDYPYFSRLFKKVTGNTALDFRQKSLD